MSTESFSFVVFHWFTNYLKDPLHKSSLFLIGSAMANAIIGFLFWMMAARLYAPSVIGLATALISSSNLIAIFSGGSFYIGLIRFLPEEKDKSVLINVCFTIAGVIALLFVLIFIAGLPIWSPALLLLHEDIILTLIFILLTVASCLSVLQAAVFIALRATKFALIQVLVSGFRIAILVPMIPLGVAGIFSSVAGSTFIVLIVSFIFLCKLEPGYRPITTIQKKIAGKIFVFSMGNFVADGFKQLPGMLMPLIIINILDPNSSAFFYIAWMINTIFLAISYSVHSSLLAETSHSPAELRPQLIKAVKFMLCLLIPAALFFLIFGDFILSLFGPSYAQEADELLRLLIISSIFVALNELSVAVVRYEKQYKPVILIYTVIAVFTIAGSYFSLPFIGLTGIGVSWLAAQIVVIIFTLPLLLKKIYVCKRKL